MLESLVNKVAGLKAFFIEHIRWLLLIIVSLSFKFSRLYITYMNLQLQEILVTMITLKLPFKESKNPLG